MASNLVSNKGSVSAESAGDHVIIKLHKERAKDLLLALTHALSGGGSGKSGKDKAGASAKASAVTSKGAAVVSKGSKY